MNELLLFRLFALFPFIGIAMPDLANWFDGARGSIPAEHIIVDITLALCLIICSLALWLMDAAKLKHTQLA